VLIHAEGHDAGFGSPPLGALAWFGRHLAPLRRARRSKTTRASSRDWACLELDKTLRASVPKVSALGSSPTSALPCVVSRSILCHLAKRFPESGFYGLLFPLAQDPVSRDYP
jgi:hypothetical protein